VSQIHNYMLKSGIHSIDLDHAKVNGCNHGVSD
jgi:hypothetical protein